MRFYGAFGIKVRVFQFCLVLLCLGGSLFADVVSVSPVKADLAGVPWGLNKSLQVVLSNGAHKPLLISSIAMTGDSSVDFAVQYTTCPTTLGASQSCTIGVLFSPMSLGLKSATLAVEDNANNSPQKVKLSGTGIAPVLLSVAVSPSSVTTIVGQTQQFSATGNYSNGSTQDLTGSVIWTVSVPSVATIGGTGLAMAIGIGSTNISAYLGGIFGSGSMSVGPARTLTSIRVSPGSVAILLGQTQQFNATGNYNDGSIQDLTSMADWTVSMPSVATISRPGLATPAGLGSTSIMASFNGIIGSGSLKVEVVPYSVTGSMTTGREEHTATTLNDGKVLVVGGYSEFQAIPVPEVYDPATGTFSLTGTASTDRFSHTATLLPNGLVLIAGGSSKFAILPSAELYDPSTGSFHGTGPMSTPRYRHTATLLKTGQVLIAGGEDPGGPVSSAEIYDPATGQFTSVGSMALAHSEHTATLLVDGRVLISSGRCFCFDKSGGGLTATAELFDPATQTFTSTGSLLTQRAGHSAALLANGKVLVAAGYTNLPQIVATNGELYDPGTGLFTETGPMVTPRIQQTTNVLLNGNVLIVGGTQTAGAGNLASGEVYDWSTGEFTAVPGSMSITREFAAAALLPSGDVLITGGFDGHVFSATAEIYVAGN
jgi:hypothetical protein